MNDYYFKVDTTDGFKYCCFSANSYPRAVRNLLFACFSHDLQKELEEPIKRVYPSDNDRFHELVDRYLDYVQDSDKETFDKFDPYQHE